MATDYGSGGGGRPQSWHNTIRGLSTMQNMENGQAAALGRAAILEAQQRQAATGGAPGTRDGRRRTILYIVMAVIVLTVLIVLYFLFLYTPSSSSSTTIASPTPATPAPYPSPTPKPVATVTPSPTVTVVETPAPTGTGIKVTESSKSYSTDFCSGPSGWTTLSGVWTGIGCELVQTEPTKATAQIWIPGPDYSSVYVNASFTVTDVRGRGAAAARERGRLGGASE